MGRQIAGRGAQHDARARELPADQGGVWQRGDPDRHIEAFLDEVDGAVGQRHLELHLRVQVAERAPEWRQMANAEGDRGVDAQQPACRTAARMQLGFGFLEPGEQLPAAGVEALAILGQRQASGRAVQQAHAESRFQLAHIARGGRLGQPERLGRAHEAAGIHHCAEGLHFDKAVHCLFQWNSFLLGYSFISIWMPPKVPSMVSAAPQDAEPTDR